MLRGLLPLMGSACVVLVPCSARELWECTSHVGQAKDAPLVYDLYEVKDGKVRSVGGAVSDQVLINDQTGLITLESFSAPMPASGQMKIVRIIGIDKKTGAFLKTSIFLDAELKGPSTDRGTCRRLQ